MGPRSLPQATRSAGGTASADPLRNRRADPPRLGMGVRFRSVDAATDLYSEESDGRVLVPGEPLVSTARRTPPDLSASPTIAPRAHPSPSLHLPATCHLIPAGHAGSPSASLRAWAKNASLPPSSRCSPATMAHGRAAPPSMQSPVRPDRKIFLILYLMAWRRVPVWSRTELGDLSGVAGPAWVVVSGPVYAAIGSDGVLAPDAWRRLGWLAGGALIHFPGQQVRLSVRVCRW
jgi:hypothetical protein